jgi:hypothetical protein
MHLCRKDIPGDVIRLLIKPDSHPSPSLRTAQILLTLQITNWSLNKKIYASMPPGRSPQLFLLQCFLFLFPFLSIKFCYCFAVCVSVQFSVQVTQELGILLD